jgi:hypothetical protein
MIQEDEATEGIERHSQLIYNEQIEQQADWPAGGEADAALFTPINGRPRVFVPPIDAGDENKKNRPPHQDQVVDEFDE